MNSIYISKMGTISLLIIASLTIMVGTVVAPALLTVSSNLEVSSYAPWLITVPSLGVVIFSFFFGKIIEKIGYYNALVIGLFLYGFFGFAAMFLQGAFWVFLDRFFLGGATGIVLVCVNGLISAFFQGKQRLKMIALQAISIEFGGVVILAVSGFLSVISWEYPFYIYLFAWVFLAMLFLFIPNPHKKTQEEKDLEATEIKSSVKKVFIALLASMFLFFIAIIILPLYLPKYGFGEDKIGYFLSFISFIAILAAGMIPRLTRVLKEKSVIALAFISYAIAHGVFYMATDFITFIFGGIFLGIGFGFSIPMLNHMTIEKSSKKNLSKNLSLYTMLIFLGQFIATFCQFFPGDYSNIFFIAAVLSFLVVCFSLIFEKGYFLDKIKRCKKRKTI